MRHPEGEKKVEREKDIYLREEPQTEGGKERTGRSVCACVCVRETVYSLNY